MNKIKIIIDSTADLNQDYIKENDIEIIGLGVNFNEENYIDGQDIITEELYKKVQEKNILPKTNAITIAKFLEVFKKYIDQGYDIFYTGISSKMSSSYNNATLASQEFPEGRILVYDSYNLSTGIGLQVLKVVELRKQGKNLQDIDEYLNSIKLNVRSQFIIETLDYLFKGGRCSALSYFFGKHLNIKPIIGVKDGTMYVKRKVIGKTIKGLDLMVDMLKQDLKSLDLGTVMITSSIAPESEKYLYEKLSQIIDPKHIMVTHAGCVISSHCGPGTIGILYIIK